MRGLVIGEQTSCFNEHVESYSQLDVTADVKDVLQHAYKKGQFQMAGIVRVAEAEDRSLIVLVEWVGFEVEERTWEPLKVFSRPLRNCWRRRYVSCE